MYFYEVEVYHPLLGSEKIILRHNNRFDNHQLNVIVQEAFDECIEKYCDKPLLDKGEEACRMEVETIFEEYLPLQLKNHGFKNIKINETCSILGGTLFCDNGVNNPILMDRYKNEVLPPCKKCIRKEYVGYVENCIVPNTRKDTSLPTTRVVRTIPVNLDEKEENTKDDFNISVLKQYFIYFKNSIEKIEIAIIALDDFFDSYGFNDCWIDHDIKVGSEHEGDIFCGFDMESDEKRAKSLLINDGFILQETKDGFWSKDGFWITGVKE